MLLQTQGCSHYRRRCKILSPCCGEVFWCRHCHNQVHMEDEPVRSSMAFPLACICMIHSRAAADAAAACLGLQPALDARQVVDFRVVTPSS